MCKAFCSKVKKNPSIILNNGEIGLNLILVEEREGVLIFEKRYDNQAGYIFVICEEKIDEEKFKKRYNCYSKFVREKANSMFKEVELVIVSKEIDEKVNGIINGYNSSFVERKPIRCIIIKS